MIVSLPLKAALLLWLIAEVLVFVAVAHWLGAGTAILAGLVASALGVWLLKRRGQAAMSRLRASLGGRASADGIILDDTLAALGALALIVPGFLSDAVGLALTIPPVRQRAAHLVRRHGPRMVATRTTRSAGGASAERPAPAIDLDQGEWRHLDGEPRDPRRSS